MDHMFNGDYNLIKSDLSNFDTSKVTNMEYMLGNTVGVLVSDSKGNLCNRSGIQKLILGNNTKLNDSIRLPEINPQHINTNTTKYTGKWQYIKDLDGNLPSNNSEYYTSTELVIKIINPGTYVWKIDKSEINIKNIVIIKGPKSTWDVSDNLVNAIDENGNPLELECLSCVTDLIVTF